MREIPQRQEEMQEKVLAENLKEGNLSRKKNDPALAKHQRGLENAEISQDILKMEFIGDLSKSNS